MKKYIIGIISYLPDKLYNKRKKALENTLITLYKHFPDFPVVIIAQNYKDNFIPNHPQNQQLFIKYFDKLGIVKARLTLQQELLNYDFDYAILVDDDLNLLGNNPKQFLETFENMDNGFAFRQRFQNPCSSHMRYMTASLNFCVISKDILSKEFIDLRFDPEKNIAFEDMIWPSLLYNKYPEKEIEWPVGTLFAHYSLEAARLSTWMPAAAKDPLIKQDARFLKCENTKKVCQYIDKYKKYPEFKLTESKELIIIEGDTTNDNN